MLGESHVCHGFNKGIRFIIRYFAITKKQLCGIQFGCHTIQNMAVFVLIKTYHT